MNNERSDESGRYVWAAILIILAVVLAAVAFVTWVIRADADTGARHGNMENGARSTTYDLAETPYEYNVYETPEWSMGNAVDNSYTAR